MNNKKFQFRVLVGATEEACKANYDLLINPTTHLHDPYTFYLFDKGGVGYLGDTPLFGGDASKFNMLNTNKHFSELKPDSFYFITGDCVLDDGQDPVVVSYQAKAGSIWITNGSSIPSEISWTNFNTYMARYIAASAIKASDILDDTYTGNETSIMTSAAVKQLIDVNIDNILHISFFKDVKTVTLTTADIASNPKVVTFETGEIDSTTGDPITATAPITANDHEGDIGLVFKVQFGDTYNPSDNDGDGWVFVNLHSLINLYVPDNAAETTVTSITDDSSHHTKKIKVEVNKSDVTVDNYETIIMNAVDTVFGHFENNTADYDPDNDNLSNNKFITESKFVEVLARVLTNYTSYTMSASGQSMEEEEEP
jgi:hypothetical protein